MLKKFVSLMTITAMVFAMPVIGLFPVVYAADDFVIAFDNFDSLQENTVLVTSNVHSGWSGISAGKGVVENDPLSVSSPLGEGNMVAKITPSADWNPYGFHKDFNYDITGEGIKPFVVSGKMFVPTDSTAVYSYLRLRGFDSTTTQGTLETLGFHANNSIRAVFGGTTSTWGNWNRGEWISYVIYYNPILTDGNYGTYLSNRIFLSGGITPGAGSTTGAPYEVFGDNFIKGNASLEWSRLSNASGTHLRVYIPIMNGTPAAAGQSGYLDDVMIYQPGNFRLASVDKGAQVPVADRRVAVNFNHHADFTTLIKENVTVTKKNDTETVNIEDVEVDPLNIERFYIVFSEDLDHNTSYTITVDADNVKDITQAGLESGSNTIDFRTDMEPGQTAVIQSVTVSAPYNITQSLSGSGTQEAITFTASPVPDSNIDVNTIKWYVDGEEQPVIGLDFNYTPPNMVGAYSIIARVSDNPSAADEKIVAVSSGTQMSEGATYLEDDFEGYSIQIGDTIPNESGVKWNNGAGVRVLSLDPEMGENMVVEFTGNSSYARLNKTNVPITAPMHVTGRIRSVSSSVFSLLMTNASNGHVNNGKSFRLLNNTGGNIRLGAGGDNGVPSNTGAQWVADKWLTFEGIIIPNIQNPAASKSIWTFSGEGLAGETSTFTKPLDLSLMDLSNTQFSIQRDLNSGTVYVDDVNIYTAPEFEIDIPGNENIGLNDKIVLTFNSQADAESLSPEQILVSKVDGNAVLVKSIDLYPNKISAVVEFDETLEDDSVYNVGLAQNVRNIYGNPPYNTVYFATGNAQPPERQEDKKIISISIDPTEISVWQDFEFPVGKPLTAAVTILPVDASNQNLDWSSSNTDAAVVNGQGEITLLAEGETVITATSADGTNLSATMALTVTPPKNRAANQKLNLPATTEPRININQHLSWPENVGEGQVALWSGNKTAAYTMTVDDSIIGEFGKWNEYKTEYGMPATFFVMTEDGKTVPNHVSGWNEQVDHGHSVQSHHTRDMDSNIQASLAPAQVIYDMSYPIQVLNDNVYNGENKARALAYSWGSSVNRDYAKQFYIGVRGAGGNNNLLGVANTADKVDYMYTRSISVTYSMDVNLLCNVVDALKTNGSEIYGGLGSLHCHGLTGNSGTNTALATRLGVDASTKFTAGEVLEYFLEEYLTPAYDNGDGWLWVDHYDKISMYAQQRDTATLNIVESTSDKIRYTLTDEMDDDMFDFPLTVKIRVPETWTAVNAIHDGVAISASLVENENGRFALVETVPDRGEVTLMNNFIQTYADCGVEVTGEAVSETVSDFLLTASVELQDGKTMHAYLVKYKDRKVVDLDTQTLTVNGELSLSLPKTMEGENIRLFIWDTDMKPLMDSVTLD